MIITPCKEISQEGRKKYAKEFERTVSDAYERPQTVPVFKSWATKKKPLIIYRALEWNTQEGTASQQDGLTQQIVKERPEMIKLFPSNITAPQ